MYTCQTCTRNLLCMLLWPENVKILFCTCPPLCAGALWPMPAWVWRDVRLVFFSFVQAAAS